MPPSRACFLGSGPEARAKLSAYVSDRLKPGGLCYVQYTSMPSSAMSTIVGTLTKLFSETGLGDSAARVSHGLMTVSELLSAPGLEFNQFFPQSARYYGRAIQA